MTTRTRGAAALAAILVLSTEAWARGPAPLVPTALVEDVNSATAGVEFMEYVGPGQTIKLEPRDTLVLSYLKSCAHETIVGGTVLVGAEHSDVQDGKVARTKAPCDGGKMRLTSQQANASGASAFRLQSVAVEPTLYALPPMIQIPTLQASDSRMLTIERIDRRGKRLEIRLGEDLAAGGFFDLAKADIRPLIRGATYTASLSGSKITFKVHPKARSGKAPVISRLLRLPAG